MSIIYFHLLFSLFNLMIKLLFTPVNLYSGFIFKAIWQNVVLPLNLIHSHQYNGGSSKFWSFHLYIKTTFCSFYLFYFWFDQLFTFIVTYFSFIFKINVTGCLLMVEFNPLRFSIMANILNFIFFIFLIAFVVQVFMHSRSYLF